MAARPTWALSERAASRVSADVGGAEDGLGAAGASAAGGVDAASAAVLLSTGSDGVVERTGLLAERGGLAVALERVGAPPSVA